MDLSKYDTTLADEGIFVHLRAPDGELITTEGEDRLPVGFRVLGATSKKFKRLQKEMKAERAKNITTTRSGHIKGLEGAEEANRELYANMVVSFVNFVLEKRDYSNETPTVGMVLQIWDRFPWMENQVVDAVEDETRFMGKSESS